MFVAEITLNIREDYLSDATQAAWGIIFILLSIFWAYYDAKESNFDGPFEFGFLVYIFWPVALPWYLVTTRGLEGVFVLLGLIALWIGPWLSGVVAYFYWA